MKRKLLFRKFAILRTTTVKRGRSASKSAKNSEKRGITYVMRIAISATDSTIRISG